MNQQYPVQPSGNGQQPQIPQPNPLAPAQYQQPQQQQMPPPLAQPQQQWQQPQQQWAPPSEQQFVPQAPAPIAPMQQPAPTSQPVPDAPLVQPGGSAMDNPFAPAPPEPPAPIPAPAQIQDPSVAAYAQYTEQQNQPTAPPNPFAPKQPEPEWNLEQHFQSQYGAPEWKPVYDQALTQGVVVKDPASGHYIAASPEVAPMAAGLLPAMNAVSQHREYKVAEIFNGNPYQNFYGAMEEPIKRLINERAGAIVEETLQKREQDKFVADYEKTNQSWLYTTDPTTGQQVPTQAGASLRASASELYNQGLDLKQAIEYAELRVKPGVQQYQQAQQPTAASQEQPFTLPPDPAMQQALANQMAPQQSQLQPPMTPAPQIPPQTALPPQQQPAPQQPNWQAQTGFTPQPVAPVQPPTQSSFIDNAIVAQPSPIPSDVPSMTQTDLESLFTRTAEAQLGLTT